MSTHRMSFLDAPQENLQTWNLVAKILLVSAGGAAAVLLIMATLLL